MPATSKLLTAGGFLSFFVFGFVDNLKGPLLPDMVRTGELTYSQVGTIFLVGYVGFVLATLGCGVLADRVSNRSVLFLAGIALCIGGYGFSATSTYPLRIAFMSVIGMGLGAIELGGNGLMVELHSEARGRYLNLLSTFHGLGSLIVPLFAAALLKIGFDWQWIYGSSAALAMLLAAVFWQSVANLKSSFPSSTTQNLERRRRVPAGSTMWRAGFTKQMWLYYLLISTYVALELSVGAWMIEYLQRARGMSIASSSLFLSGFFVLLMSGRLLGAFVVDAVGHHRAIATALIGSCICLTVGIFAHPSMVVLVPLSGLFMSIVFPTVTASVSAIHKENIGSILGILFAFSGVGGAVGPWTVGIVSDWAGIEIGLASTLVFGLIAIAALAALGPVSSQSETCIVTAMDSGARVQCRLPNSK